MLTKLAPIGAVGLRDRSPTATCCRTSPIAAIQAGQYLKVPMLAGNTRDEGKLFPTLFPLAGGHRQRPPAQRRDGVLDGVQLQPGRGARRRRSSSGFPASYLPTTTPVTGFNAKTDQLTRHLLPRQPRQRADRR